MKRLIIAVLAFLVTVISSFAQSIAKKDIQQGAMQTIKDENNEVVNDLLQGNKRFVENTMEHPHQDTVYMHKLSGAQHPKAIVIACADSRVSPEIVFDQGLGDLFVIRNAGNAIDDDVLGSMEYAIEHLGVRTIVVLGHEKCGAVTATVNHVKTNNHIIALEKSIEPAFKLVEKEAGDKIHNTVVQNVELSISKIKKDKTLLPESLHLNDLNIYGAVYDLATGTITPVGH